MNCTDMSNEELRVVKAACEAELTRRYREVTEGVARRLAGALQKTAKFEPDELVYAALERCECGCGMAYPDGIGMQGAWYCSGILLGHAEAGSTHSSPLVFAFYEIKSEREHSANGATTRGTL